MKMPEPGSPDWPANVTLYGAAGSGSIAVEAALTLLDIPYSLIEGATWTEESARDRVAPRNPMRQVPTLVFPGGEVMTESAAILIHLAEVHPHARLCPATPGQQRRQFLRWMVYVSSAIYSLHWIKPDVQRIGAPLELRDTIVQAVHDRIAFCWSNMDAQLRPGNYLLGDELTVLDLYVTVVSRFGPWRKRFYEVAPEMAAVVRRVDAEPRLAGFWARRFPFEEGWE
jgi:GST-like protein